MLHHISEDAQVSMFIGYLIISFSYDQGPGKRRVARGRVLQGPPPPISEPGRVGPIHLEWPVRGKKIGPARPGSEICLLGLSASATIAARETLWV